MKLVTTLMVAVVGLGVTSPARAQEPPPPPDTTPPQVACRVGKSGLWPPNHNLINVGLQVVASDDSGTAPAIGVLVYSNQDDEAGGSGNFSPDAKFANGTLRLRSERVGGDKPGRVYLIIVTATDAAGNVAHDCCTVVVPHDKSKATTAAIADEAGDAEDFCMDFGAPPPDYVLVGDGPVIGPKNKQ